MWLSTALLPCCEVEAAVIRHAQALQPDCPHPTEQALDSGNSHKSGACTGIGASALASAERPDAPGGGKLVPPVLSISVASQILPPLPLRSLPLSLCAAPPPVAVYLRSQRLLI